MGTKKTTVTHKNATFCGLVGGYQCFVVTHFLRLQDRIELGQAVDKSMNRHAAVELEPD